MRVMTLPEVCLGMIGFFLVFLIPAVILVAVVKVKKIRLTPVVIWIGVGIVWFAATLILLPMDPRSRQLSWLTIVAWALAAGLLGFLGIVLDSLLRVLGLPNTETGIKRLEPLARHQNQPCGGEDASQIRTGPTEDDRPSNDHLSHP